MPVILDKADFAVWLAGTGGIELLRSVAARPERKDIRWVRPPAWLANQA